MQVRRTPVGFFLCIEDVYKFMRFLAFPFGVKIVAKPQVWCASKAYTVDNPQPQSLRVLYNTLLFCFGEQRINKQRLVRKLVKNSQMNEKICQWSYRFWMYKVKWWLKRQWKLIHRLNIDYRTLKLKIVQAIWLWWQSGCSPFYSLIECRKFEKINMVHVCLFCRLTNLFCSSVLRCLARLFCSISLFMKLNRPTICSFRCFKKLIMYNAWF